MSQASEHYVPDTGEQTPFGLPEDERMQRFAERMRLKDARQAQATSNVESQDSAHSIWRTPADGLKVLGRTPAIFRLVPTAGNVLVTGIIKDNGLPAILDVVAGALIPQANWDLIEKWLPERDLPE